MSEVGNRQKKHAEINGKEILIANLDGKLYACADRCRHMNVRLSRGTINQNVVICPMHAAKFDITSGKKIGEPVLGTQPRKDPLPPTWQKIMEFAGQEIIFYKSLTKKPSSH